MRRFAYKAKDRNGLMVKGEVEAASASAAAGLLKNKGLVALNIADARGLLASIFKIADKVSGKEVVTFTRQLSTMINSGLPITDALLVLRNQSKGKMQKVVSEILTDVSEGDSLSKACGKHPAIFSGTYIAILKAGEAGGAIEKVLLRLSENMERQQQFKAKIQGAMIYPAIVVIGMVVVALAMMLFVMPKMSSLYAEMGITLPLATRILVGLSGRMMRFWPVVLILGGTAVWGVSTYIKTPLGKLAFDGLMLKLPLIGELQRKVILTDLTRTLSLLLSSGVSILEGLSVGVGTVGNEVIRLAIKDASTQVEKGFPIAYSFAKHPEAFPYLLSQMTAVGEQTGKTDEVLLKVSQIFETESDNQLKALTAAIEPIIMVVLGVGVAFLVIAIIMPIYNLTAEMGV